MSTNLQRYQWSDAIVEAGVANVIGNGELTTAMKLARAINWNPRDGRSPGLYWANELAADVCGIGRATFYRNVGKLKSTGYLRLHKGNLLPSLPETHRACADAFTQRMNYLTERGPYQKEPATSLLGMCEYQNETAGAHSDNPLSVDTCSDNH